MQRVEAYGSCQVKLEESDVIEARVQTGVDVRLFATNLHAPSHMEWTQDGRLLVSEHTAGRIVDITAGGDFIDSKPFAWGLEGPSSILPLPNGQLLVAEMWRGRITDITNGGDLSTAPAFVDGLRNPYSLAMVDDNIYVVERSGWSTTQVTMVMEKGRRVQKPLVTNAPSLPMAGLEGLTPPSSWPDNWTEYFAGCSAWLTPLLLSGTHTLVMNNSPLGQFLAIPEHGGDYLTLAESGKVIASGLSWMGGMYQRRSDERIFMTQPTKGTIVAIDPYANRDYRFDPPVVQGLNTPTCVRFGPDDEMLVCSIATGGVWRISGNF